jgi:LysM repeat protein
MYSLLFSKLKPANVLAARAILVLAILVMLFSMAPAAYAQSSVDSSATAALHVPANTTVYTVQRGDWLSAIARRFNTTVNAILAVNPQIRNPNHLYVGQRIYIPVKGDGGKPVDNVIVYTVQRGDWLSAIARRYNTTVNAILALNPQIRNPNRLVVGQRIRIPVVAPQPPAEFTRTRIYLVALDDGGASGPLIGCNDSIVAVNVNIEPTRAILRASLERQLGLRNAYYGQSGLYNALYQSNLQLQSVRIDNRTAIIELTGTIRMGGVCDAPRIQAQLEQVALQFSTVDRVSITVNGRPLADALR